MFSKTSEGRYGRVWSIKLRNADLCFNRITSDYCVKNGLS